MRSLATSDRPSARALSKVVAAVSSRTRARDLLRILHRMGANPSAIVPHMNHSPNFRNGRFQSYEPSLRLHPKAQTSALIAAIRVHKRGRAAAEIPVVTADPPQQPGELAVTWYGHATSVLEIDGARFLIDPVFGQRVSPFVHRGPARMHPVPGELEEMPSIDAVVLSHDHYDHLDHGSIRRLERAHQPHYVVPLGVNFHLMAWGVPPDRITALDWRQETEVRGIRLTCTEARHNSGRGLVDSQTLWSGWAFRGPRHSAFFCGDSGTSKRFAHIGADLGPFDVTLMPIGAYDPFWPDIHLDPEQAIGAHRDVNRIAADAEALVEDEAGVADDVLEGDQRIDTPGGAHEEGQRATHGRTTLTQARESVFVPIHWATFNLAMHWWSEPIRRLRRAATEADVPIVCPKVGERIDLSDGDVRQIVAGYQEPWWEACAAPEDHD